MSKELSILIVGGGLAGTCLAWQCYLQGLDFLLLDKVYVNSSSRVAAGLINPLTGKAPNLTWLAHKLFPYLFNFYPKIEAILDSKFFYPMPMFRPLKSVADANKMAENEEISLWFEFEPEKENHSGILSPYSLYKVNHTARLDTLSFIDNSAKYFESLGKYRQAEFNEAAITQTEGGILYNGNQYQAIVLCRGINEKDSLLFKEVKFTPARGRILDCEIALNKDKIYNGSAWIIPTEVGSFKMGSTFEWQPYKDDEVYRLELAEKIRQTIKLPYQVLNEQVGIRPAVHGRRPVIGKHLDINNLYIFNGLGSKGSSLAPYLAQHLLRAIITGSEIMPELRPYRF